MISTKCTDIYSMGVHKLAESNSAAEQLELKTKLSEGAFCSVYEAEFAGKAVVVKKSKSNLPAAQFDNVQRMLLREGNVLACIDHPALVNLYSVEYVNNEYLLILEKVEGTPLDKLIKDNKVSIQDTLRIARTIASGLSSVHQHGLIHRDIKPQNILIDHMSSEVKLIDFGLAITNEKVSAEQSFNGTLIYTAPEQTTLMSRPSDYRADLYSLGVVLYECISGHPPFESRNVAKLLNQHLTEVPRKLRIANEKYQELNSIIEKLLKKDPDDRFQTADELCQYLNNITDDLLTSPKQISTPSRNKYTTFGRRNELQTLNSAWNEVKEGSGRILLLTGDSGSGKSTLIQDFKSKYMESSSIHFHGKCIPEEPNPLGPISEAIEREISSSHTQISSTTIKRLSVELPNISPQFRLTTNQPLNEQEDRDGTNEQVGSTISQFIFRLSRETGCLCFIVEDIHWAHPATLGVLRSIVRNFKNYPVLVLLTARGENSQPWEISFEEVKNELKPKTIELKPLDAGAIRQLVLSSLGNHDVDSEFVRQVVFRAQGNPLTAKQYVLASLEEGVLLFNHGEWRLNSDRFNSLELPTNVIDLILRRLSRFDSETLNMLRIASVLRKDITPVVISDVCSTPLELAQEVLCFAEAEAIVESSEKSTYNFVHDKIAEALASGIGADELRNLHGKIGQVLDKLGFNAYDVATHYQLAEVTSIPAFKSALGAGREAAKNFANHEAFEFLSYCMDIGKKLSLPNSFELLETLSEVCFRLGRIEKAHQLADRAISIASTPEEKSKIHLLVAHMYGAYLDNEKARLEVLKGLRQLKCYAPTNRIVGLVVGMFEFVYGFLISLIPKAFRKVSSHELTRQKIISKLFNAAMYYASHEFDVPYSLQYTIRTFLPGKKIGNSPELSSSYSILGFLCSILKLRFFAKHFRKKGYLTAINCKNKRAIAENKFWSALSEDVLGYPVNASYQMEQTLAEDYQWLDHNKYMDGCFFLTYAHLYRGDVQSTLKWLQKGLSRAEEAIPKSAPSFLIYPAYRATTQVISNNLTEANRSLNEAKSGEKNISGDKFSWAFYVIQRIIYHLEEGEFSPEIESLIGSFHKRVERNPKKAFHHIKSFYVFSAYYYLKLYDRSPSKTNSKKLRNAIQQIQKCRSVASLRLHCDFLEASYSFVLGKISESKRRLFGVLEKSSKHNCPLIQIETLAMLSKVSKQAHHGRLPHIYASMAANIAQQTGWIRRSIQLREQWKIDTALMNDDALTADSRVLIQEQLNAILEVSSIGVEYLETNQLVVLVLDKLVQILRAERAFFLRIHSGSKDWEFVAGRDTNKHSLTSIENYSSSIIRRIIETGQPVVYSGEKKSPSTSKSIVNLNLKSIISSPVVIQGKTVGILYLDNSLAKGVFAKTHSQLLDALASQISISLERADKVRAELEKRELVSKMQQYVPPEVVQQIIIDPSKLRPRKTELTVLFIDIRGFSRIAEELSPEKLSTLTNKFLSMVSEVVIANSGIIDKAMGDAVMAFWGAPIPLEYHADHAADAALDMISGLRKLNSSLTKLGIPKIDVGIGINSGKMTVGNFGSSQRLNYTVMGDAVNIASRCEELTKTFNVQIVITNKTNKKLSRNHSARILGDTRIRGRDQSIKVFELLKSTFLPFPKDRQTFIELQFKAYMHIKRQEWDIAASLLRSCLEIRPHDSVTEMKLRAVKYYKKNPPSRNWDGTLPTLK